MIDDGMYENETSTSDLQKRTARNIFTSCGPIHKLANHFSSEDIIMITHQRPPSGNETSGRKSTLNKDNEGEESSQAVVHEYHESTGSPATKREWSRVLRKQLNPEQHSNRFEDDFVSGPLVVTTFVSIASSIVFGQPVLMLGILLALCYKVITILLRWVDYIILDDRELQNFLEFMINMVRQGKRILHRNDDDDDDDDKKGSHRRMSSKEPSVVWP